MEYTNQPVIKKDAYALLSGKSVYTDDLVPAGRLVIKLLHSPHAHVRIRPIDTGAAKRTPGVEAIFTCKSIPASGFTLAGQTYPEPSPYDRLVLDKVVWYVGDGVAITVAKNEASALQAMKLIHAKYEVYDTMLDFTKALDHPVIVHTEEDCKLLYEIGNKRLRNLHSHDESVTGDVDQTFVKCGVTLEREHHTKANAQATMGALRSYAYMGVFDHLNMVSPTQVSSHTRHVVANALELPKSQTKVIRPRTDGGFGAKQTGYTEISTAFVTRKLEKPCKLMYTREEIFTASNSHYEVEMYMKIGVMRDGETHVIDLYTLSNIGTYGEHGPTTAGLSGHKSLPIYSHVEASRFISDVVYTNTMTAGVHHGYGVTQGQFAIESAVNELAGTLHINPCELCLKNMVQEDEVMKQYCGEHLSSYVLDRCLRKAMDTIDWKEKVSCRDTGDKMRGLGVALSMQEGSIANVDIALTVIKLQDDGFYTLSVGATDMGIGCNTTLAQTTAECLDRDVDSIIIQSVDTDASPYDTGFYASVATYVTSMVAMKTCEELKKQILHEAAVLLNAKEERITFDESILRVVEDDKEITLAEFVNHCFADNKSTCLIASASHCSSTFPPLFMAGITGVDIGELVGEITLVDYAAVMDCGTIINPNLAGTRTEDGIAQGIGMALYEDIMCPCKGRTRNSSFL